MNQSQLNIQIARLTGESLNTVIRRGFSLVPNYPHQSDLPDVTLVLDCPFCRRPTSYPGLTGDGSPLMAECDLCDVYFDFDLDEVYTRPASRAAVVVGRARWID